MTEFLVKHFVKDYEEIEKVSSAQPTAYWQVRWASFVTFCCSL